MVQKASVTRTPPAFLKSSLPLYSHIPSQPHLPPCYPSSIQKCFYFALGYFSASRTKTSPNMENTTPIQLPSDSLLMPLQCLWASVEMSPSPRDLPWTPNNQSTNSSSLSKFFTRYVFFFPIVLQTVVIIYIHLLNCLLPLLSLPL